ncbi:hypothetical protein AB0C96_35890 [Streptomyces sp. NPDC048506]|uniref:hypothetical protein n=1 Tax=Streptomyces sp. NPDC048506 TaxID=3155028 RepID=UPI003448D16F
MTQLCVLTEPSTELIAARPSLVGQMGATGSVPGWLGSPPGRAGRRRSSGRRTNSRPSARARLVLPDGRNTTVPEAAQDPNLENPARFNAEPTSFLETT